MNFREALTLIVDTDAPEHYCNAFYLYSRLSDLCSSSFVEKQKVQLFFKLDKRFGIVKSLFSEGLMAVPPLKALHIIVMNDISMQSYKNMIDCVAEVLFSLPTDTNKPKKAVPKKTVKKAVAPKAKKPAPKPAAPPAHAPKPPPQQQRFAPHTANSGTTRKPIMKRMAISLAVAAAIAGVVCLIILGKYITWTAWQFVIGALGGALLVAAGILAASILSDEFIWEVYQPAPFFIMFAAVVNSALFCVFGGAYKVIFIFMSAYALLVAAAGAFSAFDDMEGGWGAALVVEAVFIAVALVLELVFV